VNADPLDAYARRLAALADLEQEQQPCSPALTQRFNQKRQQLTSELQTLLGRALCPLCQPMYLETTRREHLRNCVPHSIRLLEILGRSLNSRPAGSEAMSSVSEPISRTALNSGISSASALERWRLNFPVTGKEMLSERPIRQQFSRDGSDDVQV
jgi:hypothetical protein